MYQSLVAVHVFGVLIMFGAVGVTYANMIGMAFSKDLNIIRFCSKWSLKMDHFLPISGIAILIPAIYLVFNSWGWGTAWINVSLILFLLMMAAGPLINLRKLKEINVVVNEEKGNLPSLNAMQKIRDRVLWNTVTIMTFQVLAIVYMMILKPGIIGSLVSIVLGFILGIVFSNIVLNLAEKKNPLSGFQASRKKAK